MKYLWIAGILLAGCNCEKKVIQTVGACDTQGDCAVTYTDGSTGYQMGFPTPGKEAAECN